MTQRHNMEVERVCNCSERHDGGYLHRRNCYRVTRCGHVMGSRGDGCEVTTCENVGDRDVEGIEETLASLLRKG